MVKKTKAVANTKADEKKREFEEPIYFFRC